MDNADLWAKEATGMRVGYEDFDTIDWTHDITKERLRVTKVKSMHGFRGKLMRVFDALKAWIIVVLVGVTIGVVTAAIGIVTQWLSDLKLGYCKAGFHLSKNLCCLNIDDDCSDWVDWASAVGSGANGYVLSYSIYVLLSTVFASVSCILVVSFAPYAAGSGIPEVKTILGGFIIKRFLGLTTLLIKSVSLCFSVASGLTLGKEGPLVHVACCVGNIFPRLFEKYSLNEAKKREILSAASAAGVSVAFGAPIGGVLYSLEEISYYFPYKTMWRSFFCAMVASVTLQIMNPFQTGRLVLFQVTYDRTWHIFELIFFVIIGIFGGLYGAFFIRMNLSIIAFRKRSWLREWPLQEVAILACVTALISFPNIYMRIDSGELLGGLFRECEEGDLYDVCQQDQLSVSVIFWLLMACFVRMALGMVTIGIKVPAGIFIPSMAIGACFGRVLGMIVQGIQRANPDSFLFASCSTNSKCVTPGTYAMLGAAAALCGVTRMTVSLAVIMFELTGSVTYILPTTITLIVAKFVGDAFGKGGIADDMIRLLGYPYLDNREEYTLSFTAADVMTVGKDLTVLTSRGHTIRSIGTILLETTFKGFPVVKDMDSMILVGYISRTELRYAIETARSTYGMGEDVHCYFSHDSEQNEDASSVDFRMWMDQTPLTVSLKFPMEMVLELFKKMGPRYILVLEEGRLAGLLTKKDILEHINTQGEHDSNNISMHYIENFWDSLRQRTF